MKNDSHLSQLAPHATAASPEKRLHDESLQLSDPPLLPLSSSGKRFQTNSSNSPVTVNLPDAPHVLLSAESITHDLSRLQSPPDATAVPPPEERLQYHRAQLSTETYLSPTTTVDLPPDAPHVPLPAESITQDLSRPQFFPDATAVPPPRSACNMIVHNPQQTLT